MDLVRNDKIAILNKITKLIIEGDDPKEYYLSVKDELADLSPFEVFNIHAFLDNNLDTEKIIDISGKLVNLFRSGLSNFKWNKKHDLFKKLLDEGNAIRKHFDKLKSHIKEKDFNGLKDNINFIEELKKRFLKMQNVIFSVLESKGINPKPLKVMWTLQDKVFILHKELESKINNIDNNFNVLIGKYFFLVLGIIEKEEFFLLPSLSVLLSEEELKHLEYELDSYGYAFISEGKQKEIKFEINDHEYLFKSDQGMLTLVELMGILDKVGDITFVDSNNKVKFFNTPHGHFARSTSVLGRDVRNCHPQKSIHIVNEIIEKFRSGEENQVDFWINYKGKLILISYYAIRDKKNNYLGVLELTKDITDIKNIEGEKRILDFKK